MRGISESNLRKGQGGNDPSASQRCCVIGASKQPALQTFYPLSCGAQGFLTLVLPEVLVCPDITSTRYAHIVLLCDCCGQAGSNLPDAPHCTPKLEAYGRGCLFRAH